MPRIRPSTIAAEHRALGQPPPVTARSLSRYFHRRGVAHLVAASDHTSARTQLVRPSVLLGLHSHDDVWPTIFRLGRVLWGDDFGNELAIQAQAQLDADHDKSESYTDVVGQVLRSVGAYEQGLALAKTGLTKRIERYGADHPETHLGRHNLALSHEATGDLVSAETEARAALAGFDDSTVQAPEYALQARSSLALILIAASRPAEAVELLDGRVNDMSTDAGNNLAAALRSAGRRDEASEAFRRVIEARAQAVGVHHPRTDAARVGLADTLRAAKNHDEASALYQEVIERLEATLGPQHAQTEGAVNGMSICAFNMGDLTTAGALFERLIASREHRLGRHHPKTIMTLHNLGHLRLKQGDLAAAESCFERVHEADQENLGPDHMDTAMSASALADVRAAQGDQDGAMQLWQQAADTMERVLGPDHPHAAQAVATIGIGLCGAGKTLEALPFLERSVAMMTAGTGGAAERAWTKTNLGVALERQGHIERATQIVTALIEDHTEAGDADQAEKSRVWLSELEARI
jgi:tetratricopeptide (TPR) repeat protein